MKTTKRRNSTTVKPTTFTQNGRYHNIIRLSKTQDETLYQTARALGLTRSDVVGRLIDSIERVDPPSTGTIVMKK